MVMNKKATNKKKAAAHSLGQRGEAAVADWYERAGYTIVARNWRCFEGEIDIIARRGSTLAVCEVKTRANDRFMDPALAIGRAKQAKVRTAAFRWLREHGYRRSRVRFDVGLVVSGRVQMIQGAF